MKQDEGWKASEAAKKLEEERDIAGFLKKFSVQKNFQGGLIKKFSFIKIFHGQLSFYHISPTFRERRGPRGGALCARRVELHGSLRAAQAASATHPMRSTRNAA